MTQFDLIPLDTRIAIGALGRQVGQYNVKVAKSAVGGPVLKVNLPKVAPARWVHLFEFVAGLGDGAVVTVTLCGPGPKVEEFHAGYARYLAGQAAVEAAKAAAVKAATPRKPRARKSAA